MRAIAGNAVAPFMKWAVGKQGELMNPGTGKLLLRVPSFGGTFTTSTSVG
jgi:hypothetical protein